MNDENILDLVHKIDAILNAHYDERGMDTAFDAIGALAYFSGLLLAHAPDRETRIAAHEFFMQKLNEGLLHDQFVVLH